MKPDSEMSSAFLMRGSALDQMIGFACLFGMNSIKRIRSFVRQRRGGLTWVSLGLAGPWVAWLIVILWPPIPLEISHRTTRLIVPLTADGRYVDYGRWLLGQLANAGCPSLEEATWAEFPRQADGLWPFDAPSWPFSQTPVYQDPSTHLLESDGRVRSRAEFLDAWSRLYASTVSRLEEKPWRASEYPQVAEAVRQSEDWYQQVVASFSPLGEVGPSDISSLHSLVIQPAHAGNRAMARRFLLRAALRFGSNDMDAGIQDVEFVFRLADRDRHGLSGGLLTKLGIETRAARLVIYGILASTEMSRDQLNMIRRVPLTSAADDLVRNVSWERFEVLDEAQRYHRGLPPRFVFFIPQDDKRFYKPLLDSRLRGHVDWNDVMIAVNQFYDDYLGAIRNSGEVNAYQVVAAICTDSSNSRQTAQATARAELWKDLPSVGDIAERFVDRIRWLYCRMYGVLLRRDFSMQTVRIVAELVAWRERHGHYPPTLDALNHLPEGIITDPFFGKPLIYHRMASGFELRSVGPNGVENKNGDQILIETGFPHPPDDDVILRWPMEVTSPR